MFYIFIFIWFCGAMFSYGFCAEGKPTLSEQISTLLLMLFAWPLLLGFAVRSLVDSKAMLRTQTSASGKERLEQ